MLIRNANSCATPWPRSPTAGARLYAMLPLGLPSFAGAHPGAPPGKSWPTWVTCSTGDSPSRKASRVGKIPNLCLGTKKPDRFFAALKRFRRLPGFDRSRCHVPAEKLFQGPVADALTHVGQIAMLRRMAGGPIKGENYFVADIVSGRVGAAAGRAQARIRLRRCRQTPSSKINL